MKAIIQRVNSAAVTVENKTVGKIEKGFLVLLGVCDADSDAEAVLLARKVSDLRVFTDENDKMNLSLLNIDGEALVVSNFTLCADTKKGNRPSFAHAMEPGEANRLYELFCRGRWGGSKRIFFPKMALKRCKQVNLAPICGCQWRVMALSLLFSTPTFG